MFNRSPRSVRLEDSLTNPSQHVTYAYTERFYQCDCPSKDELTSLTQLISENYYGNYGYSDYKQITGAVRCSQSIPCSEEHTGLTWHGSQLQWSKKVQMHMECTCWC
ncbi:hypothetical protein DPMN_096374 [Dreissena polymorpha]|uniref:Uncharacterized protein n=1 Tax=Dreissena polymorpha TaxID=45954 RepID=A0A9D4L9M2_DREPO|nr:hypothetical protein DPMN_096374 [Dreissena polymorpha]